MHVDAASPLLAARTGPVSTIRELQRLIIAVRLVGLRAGPADILEVEGTRNEEGVVAHKLRFESSRILRSQESIRRIGILQLRAQTAALAIRPARHDQADHVLQIPTTVAKLTRKPIEQLGVRGQFTLRTEVVHRRTQADTEELLPQTVHHRARRDRVFLRHDPLGEIEPREPFFRRALALRRQKRRGRRQHPRTGLVLPITSRQHAHLERRGRLCNQTPRTPFIQIPQRGEKLPRRIEVSLIRNGAQPPRIHHRGRLGGRALLRRHRESRNQIRRRRPERVDCTERRKRKPQRQHVITRDGHLNRFTRRNFGGAVQQPDGLKRPGRVGPRQTPLGTHA